MLGRLRRNFSIGAKRSQLPYLCMTYEAIIYDLMCLPFELLAKNCYTFWSKWTNVAAFFFRFLPITQTVGTLCNVLPDESYTGPGWPKSFDPNVVKDFII